MNITLSNSNSKLSGKIISRLVTEENPDKATALGLWEKFKDLFRTEKKADVVQELYNLLHENENSTPSTSGANKFFRFEKIKYMADPASQRLFQTEIKFVTPDIRRYILIINGSAICDFSGPGSWDALSKLEFDGKPLIDNYDDIIKQYAQAHAGDFKKEYPETYAKDIVGEEKMMMDYGLYFLKNNPEIKNTLLEFGIANGDACDTLGAEIGKPGEQREQRESTVLTLAGVLRTLDNLY